MRLRCPFAQPPTPPHAHGNRACPRSCTSLRAMQARRARSRSARCACRSTRQARRYACCRAATATTASASTGAASSPRCSNVAPRVRAPPTARSMMPPLSPTAGGCSRARRRPRALCPSARSAKTSRFASVAAMDPRQRGSSSSGAAPAAPPPTLPANGAKRRPARRASRTRRHQWRRSAPSRTRGARRARGWRRQRRQESRRWRWALQLEALLALLPACEVICDMQTY